MMARLRYSDDEGWSEVKNINRHAVYMGHLSMGVKWLSILVVTWTTVVLLGGFVSVLEKKDFWCLTVITLVQPAVVVDVSVQGSFRNFWRAYIGSLDDMVPDHLPIPCSAIPCLPLVVVFLAFGAVLLLVFVIILLPMVLLYNLGLYISTGISLWRLIQRDYGVAGGGGDASKANLTPALDVLYVLELFQGVLFCYKMLVALTEKKISSRVVKQYEGFPDPATETVYDYMQKTRAGSEKDPSFARGRNLVTYVVQDLLDSSSPASFVSGVRALDALIKKQANPDDRPWNAWQHSLEKILAQHVLMKQLLLGSSSSSHMIWKLLQTLDSRSPYDREVRGCAARIVAYIAGDVRLGQFPGGIRCVASLLDAFEEYSSMEPYQRDWLLDAFDDPDPGTLRHKYILLSSHGAWDNADADADADGLREGYEELVLQGMRILRKLAADDGNCRIISDTPGLLSRIMAYLTSELLYATDHPGSWRHDVADASLRVVCRLAAAPGDVGTDLRRAISGDAGAIASMQSVLQPPSCGAWQSTMIIQILTQLLSMDGTSSSLGTESRQGFITILLHLFQSQEPDGSVRKLGGEKLAMLCAQSKRNADIVLRGNVDRLVELLLQEDAENEYRTSAAQILGNLCMHYDEDDERVRTLKEAMAMTTAMPKVLTEILPCESTGEQPPGAINLVEVKIEYTTYSSVVCPLAILCIPDVWLDD